MSMGLDPGTPSQAAGGNTLQIGDLVQFPLGGPVMKVIDIQNDNVICQWTTDAGQVDERRALAFEEISAIEEIVEAIRRLPTDTKAVELSRVLNELKGSG